MEKALQEEKKHHEEKGEEESTSVSDLEAANKTEKKIPEHHLHVKEKPYEKDRPRTIWEVITGTSFYFFLLPFTIFLFPTCYFLLSFPYFLLPTCHLYYLLLASRSLLRTFC